MPPPARSDLLISRALRALFKFSGRVAGKDGMRVRVHETRQDYSSASIDYFAVAHALPPIARFRRA